MIKVYVRQKLLFCARLRFVLGHFFTCFCVGLIRLDLSHVIVGFVMLGYVSLFVFSVFSEVLCQ